MVILSAFLSDWKMDDFCKFFKDISESFVQKELKRGVFKASTIKNYLISMSHYLDFIKLAPTKSKVLLTDRIIEKFQRQIKIWNQTLTKRITVETVDRQMLDQGEKIFVIVNIYFHCLKDF